MIKDVSTAPRDGTQFLGDFGNGGWQLAIWCDYEVSYIYLDLRTEYSNDGSDYQITRPIALERPKSSLLQWTELPEFKKVSNNHGIS